MSNKNIGQLIRLKIDIKIKIKVIVLQRNLYKLLTYLIVFKINNQKKTSNLLKVE